jgi:hypothetical protein
MPPHKRLTAMLRFLRALLIVDSPLGGFLRIFVLGPRAGPPSPLSCPPERHRIRLYRAQVTVWL